MKARLVWIMFVLCGAASLQAGKQGTHDHNGYKKGKQEDRHKRKWWRNIKPASQNTLAPKNDASKLDEALLKSGQASEPVICPSCVEKINADELSSDWYIVGLEEARCMQENRGHSSLCDAFNAVLHIRSKPFTCFICLRETIGISSQEEQAVAIFDQVTEGDIDDFVHLLGDGK